MKFQSIVIATTSALIVSGCGHVTASSSQSPTTQNSPMSAAPSISPNQIDAHAATAYEAALKQSLSSANNDGLTELWTDPSGALVTVMVQSPHNGPCAQSDIVENSTELVDSGAMMPSVLLDELDGLKANSGSDVGSVASPRQGTFIITNIVADSHYTTTYTVDRQGRIATASQMIDGDLAAMATFTYHVTADGKKALAAAK